MRYRDDHLAYVREMEQAVRDRPRGVTPNQVRAQYLAILESWVIQNAATVATVVADQKRQEGAGLILMRSRGQGSVTEEHITRTVHQHNVASEVAEAIRRIVPVIPAAVSPRRES